MALGEMVDVGHLGNRQRTESKNYHCVLRQARDSCSSPWDSIPPRLSNLLGYSPSDDGRPNVVDVVQGVSPWGGSTALPLYDAFARSFSLSLVWVVSLHAGCTALFSHRERFKQLASRIVGDDTISAARTIHKILDSVDDHGIVDIFSKHEPKQIIASIYALSKLQAACQRHERENDVLSGSNRGNGLSQELINDLCKCAPFAIAAYGWKLDLATAGKLHRGDLNAVLKLTSISPSDVVTVNWESRPNRPAFYIARDRKRKRIILSIRGTWTAHDLLTDLCCTPEDYHVSLWRSHRAHSGMLEAARNVGSLAKETIEQELKDHPGYSLLLVGHSLGGSVAAILGTLWETEFSDITVYVYGPACVTSTSMGSDKGLSIVSVVLEGDPFSCLSLGHVADVSGALDYLCQNRELRSAILMNTDGPAKMLDSRALEWCSERMQEIQASMTPGEKLYPPGRLLFIHQDKKGSHCEIQEVSRTFFQHLRIGPKMFDLTRHVPRLYEASLRDGIVRKNKEN
eukprot:scaffold6052_cov118-Cylindrotheca_fusiformis.AAC.2